MPFSSLPEVKSTIGKTVTYGRIVAEIRPHKAETHRVLFTVGGYRMKFDGVTETLCTGLVTTKIMFNSTVSTPGDHFCTFDIKDLYYGTSMEY